MRLLVRSEAGVPLLTRPETRTRSALRRAAAVVACLVLTATVWVASAAPAMAAEPVAPRMYATPTAVTATTLSVRFLRSPSPDLVCTADIGYEMLGGTFADWRDVGGFPNAPCADPDPGYKFSGLSPSTTYTFTVRAYRLTGTVKEYSTASSMTATTAAATTPTPTPTPTPTSTPTPTPTPTPSVGSVNPPSMYAAPTAVTTTSISVRFLRSPAPDRMCKPDIGYEVRGGTITDWRDVGGFSTDCDDPDPGYKFSGLGVNVEYTLSIRAYRILDGVKEHSASSSTTVRTKGVAAPTLSPAPTATTATSISIRFLRSAAPDRVCKPDIGYEVQGGASVGWLDVGGFPNAPCDDPDIGYKFTGLTSGRSYTLSIRAYRLTSGVKEYSTAPSLTASTVATSTPPGDAGAVSPPSLSPRPSSVSSTSISIRFLRSPAPDLVCKPDIGYEVLGGTFGEWWDVGGFPNAPCDDPDVGYKFGGLTPATTYTLSIRAYRVVDGAKSYSSVASLSATTLSAVAP